ncbi:unnamed protein product [Heligmosomoides polygyrus]|uniref:CYCLIN domain-containing protein n=1 Tax=Heligmosomoides polygyrus TaxID=6339 RepID=A0A3P8CCB5_HELPZ|nr:unnamed protein product [Heligmosomoides polygyrus]
MGLFILRDKSDKSDKSDKGDKSDKSDKGDKSDKSDWGDGCGVMYVINHSILDTNHVRSQSTALLVMDVQGRRTTRALSTVNENIVKRTAAGKDALLTRRPALKDQRNGANVPAAAADPNAKPVARATRSVAVRSNVHQAQVNNEQQKKEQIPDRIHPEVTGIDREIQYVEYCDQVYEYLLDREKMCLVEEDFMAHSPATPKMRGILVDWLIQVHTRFHLLPETLHLTIYLLDIMLSRTKVDKGELQLVGVASMLVASKYEEMYAPDIHDFEYITDNAYSKKQILKMEAKILIAANFDLSRPHSLTFLRWYSKEMKFGVRMHHMAKYLIEETDGYHETGNGGAGVDVREGDPEVAVVTETSRRAREVLIGQGYLVALPWQVVCHGSSGVEQLQKKKIDADPRVQLVNMAYEGKRTLQTKQGIDLTWP